DIVKDSEFSVFKEVIKNKGIVKCINPEKDFTRTELEQLTDFCIKSGGKGMAYLRVSNGKLEGSILKYLSSSIQKEIIQKTKIKKGYLLFIADKPKKANSVLSELRNKLGKDLGLIKENDFKFTWVIDFPLFSYNDEENRWEPEHHMFTSPKPEHLPILESKPGEVLGDLYDIVLNGTELGSGSIRITRPDIQERVMKIIGMPKEEAYKKFGFLLNAYNFAGPTHGGMGLGFDRLVALMLGYTDIREVIAFPKNKEAQNPMDDCPADVDHKQLKEAHIKIDLEKK
ncbi:MAG TPA: amino acid--tRNA ligase-related protein, partial [Candidatus Nanoarchaeia archaeon]|nr:amino acid--tRNA ligase-related protein [Candidatus Nanoarchaeia archaeon]